MRHVSRSIPALLAALLLAAHFYRGGSVILAVACVAIAVLAFVRRAPAEIVVRAALATGVIVWGHTAWRIAQARIAEGRPYHRMLVILGVVALFTALAAGLLPRARGGDGAGPAAS